MDRSRPRVRGERLEVGSGEPQRDGREGVRTGNTDRNRRFLTHGGTRMDWLYLGLGIGFFALSWAFIVACERLA
jgi:hypothetical protein